MDLHFIILLTNFYLTALYHFTKSVHHQKKFQLPEYIPADVTANNSSSLSFSLDIVFDPLLQFPGTKSKYYDSNHNHDEQGPSG